MWCVPSTRDDDRSVLKGRIHFLFLVICFLSVFFWNINLLQFIPSINRFINTDAILCLKSHVIFSVRSLFCLSLYSDPYNYGTSLQSNARAASNRTAFHFRADIFLRNENYSHQQRCSYKNVRDIFVWHILSLTGIIKDSVYFPLLLRLKIYSAFTQIIAVIMLSMSFKFECLVLDKDSN